MGGRKLWILVDAMYYDAVTLKLKEDLKLIGIHDLCPAVTRSKAFVITPQKLNEWGIPFRWHLQLPGELMIIPRKVIFYFN